jgi:hypothetical protein
MNGRRRTTENYRYNMLIYIYDRSGEALPAAVLLLVVVLLLAARRRTPRSPVSCARLPLAARAKALGPSRCCRAAPA